MVHISPTLQGKIMKQIHRILNPIEWAAKYPSNQKFRMHHTIQLHGNLYGILTGGSNIIYEIVQSYTILIASSCAHFTILKNE